MSQTAQILAALKAGEVVTPLFAYERFGCLATHSRIAELRAAGWDISCRVRNEGGRRWGEYKLMLKAAA